MLGVDSGHVDGVLFKCTTSGNFLTDVMLNRHTRPMRLKAVPNVILEASLVCFGYTGEWLTLFGIGSFSLALHSACLLFSY